MDAVPAADSPARASRGGGPLARLLLGSALLLALSVPARGQDTGGLVALALEPGADGLVPIDVQVVPRPGPLRLDPSTGAISGGATADAIALLGYDPATGALVALDLAPARRTGQVRLDPRSGAPTADAIGRPAAPPGPVLVGRDPATGTLAGVELSLVRVPGTFTLDPPSGTLSPSPDGSALLGFDAAAGALAPIRPTVRRGRALTLNPSTGRISAAAETGGGAVELLGIRPDGGTVIPVEIELAHRPGTISVDPGTGRLGAAGEAGEPGAGLSVIGISSPTGALTRTDLRVSPRPGQLAVDLTTGAVQPLATAGLDEQVVTSGFVFGGGLDVRMMTKLADVLEQVSAGPVNASEAVPGVHGYLEYAWRAISIGVEAGYTVLESEVTFPQGLQTGDMTYFEIGGSLKVRIPVEGPVRPYATVSIVRATIEGDFELEGLTESRSHETKRDGFGAGLDWWGTANWGARVEALYSTTFEDDDAADHIRWHLGVLYSPAGVGAVAD